MIKRTYSIQLDRGFRIDVFLEGDLRLIGEVVSYDNLDCILQIKNYDVIKYALSDSIHKTQIKGIYYRYEEVFGFQTNIKHVLNDKEQLILRYPNQFFKVQRRQHVRVNCFLNTEFFEVEDVKDFNIEDVKKFSEKVNQLGVILNLSGGGCELKVLTPIQSQYVILRYRYKGRTYVYQAAKRCVREVDELGVVSYRIGLEFINITSVQREQIIKLVFEKMREIQRKRLRS